MEKKLWENQIKHTSFYYYSQLLAIRKFIYISSDINCGHKRFAQFISGLFVSNSTLGPLREANFGAG